METDSPTEIDIQLLETARDDQAQRETGLYTATITVEVVHPLGSFVLPLQVEKFSLIVAEQQRLAREGIFQFADRLKESATARIHSPRPPPVDEVVSLARHAASLPLGIPTVRDAVDVSRATIIMDVVDVLPGDGEAEVYLRLKTDHGHEHRFRFDAADLVGFARTVLEQLGDE